jgi:DNA-binding transcriptional ArsR family regulator
MPFDSRDGGVRRGGFRSPERPTRMKDRLSSKECAERLKALADADRLKIVEVLRGGAKNVSQITAALSAELANVSHHLQILKREKIVETEKQGRFVVYRLHPEVFGNSRSTDECLDLGCCKLQLPK